MPMAAGFTAMTADLKSLRNCRALRRAAALRTSGKRISESESPVASMMRWGVTVCVSSIASLSATADTSSSRVT